MQEKRRRDFPKLLGILLSKRGKEEISDLSGRIRREGETRR